MLDLSVCQLSALPRSVCGVAKLRHLDIPGNGLVCLPEEFSQLVHLEELEAYDNNFPAIPEALHKMGRLATVDLSGCIYLEVPKSADYQAEEGFRSLQSLDLRCAPGGGGGGWGPACGRAVWVPLPRSPCARHRRKRPTSSASSALAARRKKLGVWKESSLEWLRSLEAALRAGAPGARRSALTWE